MEQRGRFESFSSFVRLPGIFSTGWLLDKIGTVGALQLGITCDFHSILPYVELILASIVTDLYLSHQEHVHSRGDARASYVRPWCREAVLHRGAE